MKMTFDQLQRYRMTADLITSLRNKKPLLILDAGSREGFLRKYLPDDKIINLDLTSFPINNFIRGNVFNLPFPDESLDISLALDVLEHIPSSRRIHFLNEIARVSKDLIIVGCPFHDERVEAAEKLVNEFSLKVTGKENEFLVEHLTEGLPELDDVLNWAGDKKYSAAVLTNAYLYRWLLMVCLNTYLSSLAEGWELIFPANSFYHHKFYRLDNIDQPGYRKVIVLSKSGNPRLKEMEKQLVNQPRDDTEVGDIISLVGKLADLIDSEKDKIIERQSREIIKLTGRHDFEVKKLTAIIDQKSDWVNNLEAELNGIKSTRAYKVYKNITNLIHTSET